MSETSVSVYQSALRHTPECSKLWRFGFIPAIRAAKLMFRAGKFWLSGMLAEFRKGLLASSRMSVSPSSWNILTLLRAHPILHINGVKVKRRTACV
jgi:hypothetical protein